MHASETKQRSNEGKLDPSRFPTYGLGPVVAALLAAFAVAILFDARGLHRWVAKLQVNEATRWMRQVTEAHWERMAALGFEEPKHTVETLFLDFQEAHPLLYPRKLADIRARREAKKRAHLAKASEPKDLKRVTGKKRRPGPEALGGETGKSLAARALGKITGPDVLLLGDSMMVSIGPVIGKDVEERLAGRAEVQAKVSTGLARPDVFDWQKELRRLTSRRHYDYIVIIMGTNDGQDFAVGDEILTYGTEAWVREYRRRVGRMMELACQGTRRVVWLGLPPMRTSSFNRKVMRLNTWIKRQATQTGCVDYLDLAPYYGDEQGRFIGYKTVRDELERIRTGDGIHITREGGKILSDALMERYFLAEYRPVATRPEEGKPPRRRDERVRSKGKPSASRKSVSASGPS